MATTWVERMSDNRQNDEESKGLVGMFAAERQREQDNTMDRRIEKKRFTPRRIAIFGGAACWSPSPPGSCSRSIPPR